MLHFERKTPVYNRRSAICGEYKLPLYLTSTVAETTCPACQLVLQSGGIKIRFDLPPVKKSKIKRAVLREMS